MLRPVVNKLIIVNIYFDRVKEPKLIVTYYQMFYVFVE